jgi:signal peptidase I
MIRTIIEWAVYIALLIAVFVVFHFFLMLGRIPSESMEPTLMVHDWTVGNRNAYSDDTPERGDIIIFYCESEDEVMVKRVIGLPGETVTFVGGHVYIDGDPLDESEYLANDVVTESEDTFIVPDGSYFMLGDNREVSLDSRYWENPYITVDDIQSEVIYVIPFHKLPWFNN